MANELPLVYKKNQNKFVRYHETYNIQDDSFTAGFLEAMDFLQYVNCYFNIAVADELWRPQNEYDRQNNYEYQADDTKVLVRNHFWDKYKNGSGLANGPYIFYNSLDDTNKRILYNWYKRNVNKN